MIADVQYTGQDDAVIAFATNCYLRDMEDGDGCLAVGLGDWESAHAAPVGDCEACGHGLVRGVLAPINDDFGIERCDMCAIYESDFAAAQALSVFLTLHTGVTYTIWFQPEVTLFPGDPGHPDHYEH